MNVIAIVIGTLVGVKLGVKVQKRHTKIVMRILGLVTLILGAQMLLEFRGAVPIIAVIVGGVIGHFLRIDARVNSFIARFSKSDNLAGKGFVTASVLFCVGPMSIIGPLEDGLRGNPGILLTKSGLDGVSSLIFGATFGIGVILSAVLVLILQGSITVFAGYASSVLTKSITADLTATGGALVLLIALTLLGFEKLKVENLLPALLFAAIFSAFLPRFPF